MDIQETDDSPHNNEMNDSFSSSIVLETILGADDERGVEDFFANVWQRSCAVYRRRNDDDDDGPQQRIIDVTPWRGVVPRNPLTALVERGWSVLVHLLETTRRSGDNNTAAPASSLPRGVDRPPDDRNDDDMLRERPIFFRQGEVLPSDAYDDDDGTTDVWAAFLDGVSVVLNHADARSPWIAALCEDLQSSSSFLHAYGNAYLTPAGCRTAPPHADDRDVVVVQVVGRKRWRVRDRVPVPFPYPPEQVGKDGRPVPSHVLHGPLCVDTVLRPGDVLYMPRGYVHEAVAVSSDDDAAVAAAAPSFHVTVALATHDWTPAGLLANELIPQRLFGTHVQSSLPASWDLRRAVPRSIGRDDTPPTTADLQSVQATLDAVWEDLRRTITAQTLHEHLRSKVRVHNARAKRVRTKLLLGSGPRTSPPPTTTTVGPVAAARVRFNTRIRVATTTERASVQSRRTTTTGLHVRPEVADAVSAVVAHVKTQQSSSSSSLRVCEWPDVLSTPLPPTLCPLTLLALAKRCVALGAFAVVDEE